MARYVVLSFEDNDAAEEFIGGVEDGSILSGLAKVVGLYAQPTQFCASSGSGGCGTKNSRLGWTRGKKYGWWICAECYKPSNACLKPEGLARQVISNGVNFLHQRVIAQAVDLHNPDNPPASIHDEGWGVSNHG